MPDFGRTGDNYSGDNEPSFDDIRRSDSFVDALAAGTAVAPEDPADAALAALLGGWRDEMRWPPATGLISEPQAIAALDAGLAEKPGGLRRDKRADQQVASVTPMRNRRGLSLLGAAAAAVLGIGGFVALYNGPTPVRDDAVVLAARTELEQVQQLVDQGQWQQAQEKLVAVSTQVASIGDEQQKQDLFDEFNDLSAKVVERNPEATAAPGIIYTVPPAATELVPAVAPPTSVPTASSPSDATSAATTTSAPTSAEQTGASTSPSSTTATSGAPTSSPSPASSATQAATSTATSTTTPTSAAPVTTSAPASSSVPSSPASSAVSSSPSAAQATSSAVVTTTSAAPRAASSSPASSPVSTTAVAPTTTSAPAAAPAQASTTPAQTTAQTTAAPTEDSSAEEESVPATTEVPIPVTTTTVPVAAG